MMYLYYWIGDPASKITFHAIHAMTCIKLRPLVRANTCFYTVKLTLSSHYYNYHGTTCLNIF